MLSPTPVPSQRRSLWRMQNGFDFCCQRLLYSFAKIRLTPPLRLSIFSSKFAPRPPAEKEKSDNIQSHKCVVFLDFF
jgi:hypothetical protein